MGGAPYLCLLRWHMLAPHISQQLTLQQHHLLLKR
jgi:hypothetical protein